MRRSLLLVTLLLLVLYDPVETTHGVSHFLNPASTLVRNSPCSIANSLL